MATQNEVITFWKVKVGGGGMRSTERPSSFGMVFVDHTASGVSLAHTAAAGIRGAAADRGLAVSLSRSEREHK